MSAGSSRRTRLIAPAVLALGGVNFFTGLGSSSLYTDEAFSWLAATQPTLGDLERQVSDIEVAPRLYYLGLRAVIELASSSSEATMRLPSAVAGVMVVGAILWLGTLAAGRRSGLAAMALAAVSPMVLEYAQQVRSYVFVMLAVTVAAAAMLEAERRPAGSRGRTAWLAAGAVASVAAFWTHYTAALVIVPLLLLGLVRRALSRREVVVVGGIVTAAWLPALPLMLTQLSHNHTEGLGDLATLSLDNVVDVVGAPFDTRYGYADVTVAGAIGAAIVVLAALAIAFRPPARRPLVRSLVLPLALLPVAAVVVLTIAGQGVLITRYVAVAVPFMIVLVVAAPVPRLRGGGLAAALVVAAVGSVLAHTSGGLYQDWRAGTARVAAQIRAGDAVTLTHRAVAPAFEYYAAGTAAQGAPVAGFNEGVGFDRFTRERRRVWFFASPPVPRAVLESGFATVGYRPLTAWRFGGNDPLQLVLAVPGRP